MTKLYAQRADAIWGNASVIRCVRIANGNDMTCGNEIEQDMIMDALRESNAIEGVYDDDSFLQAGKAWDYLIKQDALTPSVILKTHKILMLHQKLRPNEKGYFRTVDVYVGHKRMTPPNMIEPRLTMNFCFETMRAVPAPDWKALHVVYEDIHPFVDGNGRTGRMFLNWTRIKRCGLSPLVIWEDERQEYYQWFR